MPTARVVSKRGGRRESFSLAKLQRALQRALEGSGDAASFASKELAQCIEARLPFGPDGAIESSAIRSMAERVLDERQAPAQLASFRRYASRRERQRANLRVGGEGPAPSGRAMNEPFDPARIATHLCLHRGCARDVALEIAACVERRLLSARWTTIARDLVAATVQAECSARGIPSLGASRRDVVGPRRSEVDELLEAGCTRIGAEVTSWGQSVEQTLSALVLARHAVRAGAPRDGAEAHERGELHFLHYDAPHRRIAAAAFLAPDAFDPERTAEALADGLLSQTRRATMLIDVRGACAGRLPWKRVRVALEQQIPVWSAIARAAGGRLGIGLLVPPGAPPEGDLLELTRALDGLQLARPHVLEPLELVCAGKPAAAGNASFADPAGQATGSGGLPPFRFGTLERPNLGFGVLVRGKLDAEASADRGGTWIWGAVGGVALDLPRLAAGVSPADEGAYFARMHALLEFGLEEAQRQSARHERRARAGLGPALETRAASFAVVPIGFHEALQILWGEVTPPRAARALSFLAEAVERFGRHSGTDWFLELGDAPEVRARFERLDDAREESIGSSGYAWLTRDGRRYGCGVSPARGGTGPLDRHVLGLLSYGRAPSRAAAPSTAADLAPFGLRAVGERRNEPS